MFESLRRLKFTAAFVLMTLVAGCAGEIQVHTYDKAPIEALKAYDPAYQLDDNGRVIDLKLNNKQLDHAAFDEIGKLTALRKLSLYGSSVTDARLEKLKPIGQLRQLGLGKTAITDEGLAHLADLPKLRGLWISKGKRVSEAAVDKLKASHPDLIVYRQ